MKFIQFLIPAVCISFAATSCGKGKLFGIKGKGSNVLQIRNVTGFDEIHLSIDADVYYVQDSIYSMEISAQQNVLSQIKTDVEDGELEIDFDKRVFSHSKITITIHSPNIREFDIDGSGKIEAQNAIVTPSMELEISGSGDIFIPALTTAKLDADISGSGNIKVSGGTIANEDLEVSGSGDIDVLNAQATDASAKITGSGNISLRVSNYLNARISGSGDIKYIGTPVMDINISGSGKIIHL